jgi:tryptophanyl-tRNA synthetase
MADKFRAGGFGYGEVKKAIAEAAEAFFAPARERREQLLRNPSEVKEILAAGAAKARAKASEVLLRAQKACGIKT